MKRCTACHSTHVRRSGIYPAEVHRHPFRSPYRCLECDARFWVVSRRTRVGIASLGALAVAAVVGVGVAKIVVGPAGTRLASAASARVPAEPAADAAGSQSEERTAAREYEFRTGASQMLAPVQEPALPIR